jgi:hypothetical protein
LSGLHQDDKMEAISLKPIASGAIFGAALTAAGVYSPTVIIGQMHFTDFHMLKAFLAASASSSYAPHQTILNPYFD